MAVVFRSSSATASAIGTSPITVPLPAGLQAGDLMVLAVENNASLDGAPAAPAGWTLIGSRPVAAIGVTFFYKVAGASESAPSVSWTGTHGGAGGIVAYSGEDSAAPIDVLGTPTVSPTTSTATAASIPGVTSTFKAGAFIICAYVWGSATVTLSNRQIGGNPATTDEAGKSMGTGNNLTFGSWSWQQPAPPGATGAATATLSAGLGFNNGAVGVVIAVNPPNPYSRPAYIFGTNQAPQRAANW